VPLIPELSRRPDRCPAVLVVVLAALLAWGPAGAGAQEPEPAPPAAGPEGEAPPEEAPPPPPPPPLPDPSPQVRVLLARFGILTAERVVREEQERFVAQVAVQQEAEARLDEARDRVDAARAALVEAERRFRDVAVDAFIFASGGASHPVQEVTLFERRKGEQLTGSVREHHKEVVLAAQAALERAEQVRVERAEEVALAVAATDEQAGRVRFVEQGLVDARVELSTAEREDVPAIFERDPEGRWQLSIIGDSVFTPEELAEWFEEQGAHSRAAAPVTDLARFYIEEGEAEGVRGDMAFAQAVLETGSFSNADTIRHNNYAGIGHCDSCPSGFHFDSPHMGVRGQIQHVKSYAIRDAEFASPLVDKRLRGPSGCCQTWSQLTGVYATDPNYGPKILGIYQRMLEWLLPRRLLAAAAAVAPPA
jgi:hypothetical protein